jgi:hypothetical protein
MDGRLSNGGSGGGGEVVNHVFGQMEDGGNGVDNDRICLTLLYRPGHYDILY